MAVALVGLFVALTGTTYAATGGTFILGQANTASSQTSLTAGVAGTTTGPRSVLSLRNTSTASGAEGLAITVGANKAPIHVNSTAGKATFLNADKLDGLDSTGFYRAGTKVADSAHADSASNASNADLLNGKSAAQLQGARAFALVGGPLCPGGAVVFCPIVRGKGVSYVVKVALGTYCVGVNGINAAAADSAAIVSASYAAGNALWSYENSACDPSEFEIYTVVENTNGQIAFRSDAMAFTIAIP